MIVSFEQCYIEKSCAAPHTPLVKQSRHRQTNFFAFLNRFQMVILSTWLKENEKRIMITIYKIFFLIFLQLHSELLLIWNFYPKTLFYCIIQFRLQLQKFMTSHLVFMESCEVARKRQSNYYFLYFLFLLWINCSYLINIDERIIISLLLDFLMTF